MTVGGQGSAISPQLDMTIRILGHLDVSADQAAVFREIFQQVQHLGVLQRQAV